jgi:hypothetical protein
VAGFETALQQEFRDIPERQLVSQSPKYSEQDNICRELEII